MPATTSEKKPPVKKPHRMPGESDPKLMITLCLPCHAKVTRTRYLRRDWPPLLRVLWREQHPEGHEQTMLNFFEKKPVAKLVPLFGEEIEQKR